MGVVNFFFTGYFLFIRPYLKGRLDTDLTSEEKIHKEILVSKLVNTQIILEGLNKDLNLTYSIDRKRDEYDLQHRFLGFRKPNPKSL